MNLTFDVSNQTVTRTDSCNVVNLSQEYLYLVFTFKTTDWNSLSKYCLFKDKKGAYYKKHISTDTVLVPAKCLLDDYFTFTVYCLGDDDLSTINFTAEVQEIKTKIMPTLDDNFAKDMGFDNVEKLKETLTNNLKEDAKNASERDFTNQIEEALVKANNFDLPQSLVAYHTNLAVENFLNRMFGGKKPDLTEENRKHFAQRMQPSVEKDLRIGYLVHAIAKKENLVATEQDLQTELKKALEQNPKQKTQIEKFFKERKEEILASLNEKKVFEYLKTNAKVK